MYGWYQVKTSIKIGNGSCMEVSRVKEHFVLLRFVICSLLSFGMSIGVQRELEHNSKNA